MEKRPSFSAYAEEIHFGPQEIENFSLGHHPVQIFTEERLQVSRFGELPILPRPYMLAMDRAYLCYQRGKGKYAKGYATGELTITQEDPWFWSHFLGDPIMPGSQGVDSIMQLAGLWGGCTCDVRGRARALGGQFTYEGQVLPSSKKIFYRIDVQRFLPKKRMLYFEGSLAVDDIENKIYQFENGKLGFFTPEELGVPRNVKEYYSPDWEMATKRVVNWIETSKDFYRDEEVRCSP